MTKRKKCTSEFKREAVRLMESWGKPTADLARQLGVRRNQLYKWKEQSDKRGTDAFPAGSSGTRTVTELAENAEGFVDIPWLLLDIDR